MTSKRAVWRKRIQAWERSGLSRQSFCAARRVNVHTFDYWRRALRSTSALVPVVVAPQAVAVAPPLEVFLPNGLRLLVPAGSDPASLRAVVDALRTC